MARQSFEYPDEQIMVHVNNPGNTYVTIVEHGDDERRVRIRLKTLRKINNDINRAHWKDDD